MESIKNHLKQIDQYLDQNKFSGNPQNLYDPLNYILSLGGKRLRPVLTLISAKMFGEINQAVLAAASSIEIFHNFSLIHDDIMDQAPLRRGKETVHIKWNEATAILSGDLMLVKAYEQLVKSGAHSLQQKLELFNKTAAEVCEGQQIDMNFELQNDVSEEEYIEMIRLKTAVLLAASLKMGAIINNAHESDADLLYKYGENIGIGFQLMDDILDAFGDPETFGKQVGGDIISNKKTYLLIQLKKAVENDQIDNEKLHYWLGLKEFNQEEKVKSIIDLYLKYQIKQKAEEKMNEYFNLSQVLLNQINLSKEAKKELEFYTEYLRGRTN